MSNRFDFEKQQVLSTQTESYFAAARNKIFSCCFNQLRTGESWCCVLICGNAEVLIFPAWLSWLILWMSVLGSDRSEFVDLVQDANIVKCQTKMMITGSCCDCNCHEYLCWLVLFVLLLLSRPHSGNFVVVVSDKSSQVLMISVMGDHVSSLSQSWPQLLGQRPGEDDWWDWVSWSSNISLS